MKMNPLGRTGMLVSEMCLGTMTFGTQTKPEESHAQMDMALGQGVNFFDTAEMYPVNPIRAETVGRSEQIIGDWFHATGRRDEVILSTKHSGAGFKHARDGALISSQTIEQAIDGSLRRLRSDYIDLYQFHWPNRGSYMFRKNWAFDPSEQNRQDTQAHMEDALGALQKEVDRGRIRAFGLSNESAWGTSEWLRIAGQNGGPRVASVQNEYSLMCRLYDTDMAELSVNEDVGLLAFAPLAAGMLSGKYQGGAIPEESRMSLVPDLGGRITPQAFAAVDGYLDIAKRHQLDPVQMALAWTLTRPFMCSTILGATHLDQLQHALKSRQITLSEEVLAEIETVHRAHAMPF